MRAVGEGGRGYDIFSGRFICQARTCVLMPSYAFFTNSKHALEFKWMEFTIYQNAAMEDPLHFIILTSPTPKVNPRPKPQPLPNRTSPRPFPQKPNHKLLNTLK